MMMIKTAKGYTVPIVWIGVADYDGSLRFETTETDLVALISAFSDPEHTAVLTRIFDEVEKNYAGFTSFRSMERMPAGTTVIRLMPGT